MENHHLQSHGTQNSKSYSSISDFCQLCCPWLHSGLNLLANVLRFFGNPNEPMKCESGCNFLKSFGPLLGQITKATLIVVYFDGRVRSGHFCLANLLQSFGNPNKPMHSESECIFFEAVVAHYSRVTWETLIRTSGHNKVFQPLLPSKPAPIFWES